MLAGILVQFFAIGSWCLSTGSSPFAGETGTLSVLAWAIALAVALVDIHGRLPAVGAVAMLVACMTIGLGAAHMRSPVSGTPLLKTQITSVHVLAIVASFGLSAVAFGCASLYLVQNRLLKQHTTHGLFRRLPPLATFDSVAYRSVVFALPLLTLGLATGFIEAFASTPARPLSAWLMDPRILLSMATWGVYVFYLSARLLAGWRGVRLQYILLVGLLILLCVYLVPTSTHRFN